MVSDAEAGFPSCKKAVLGNAPTIALLPGEAVLIGLAQRAPAPPSASDAMQHLWARRGGR